MGPLLEVKDLRVSFDVRGREAEAVRGVSFQVAEGEVVAIVGESGCGKSVTAQTIMRLIPMPPGRVKSGRISFMGKELLGISEWEMEAIRGKDIGMIFQDSSSSLNPTMTIGRQIGEGLIKDRKMSMRQAMKLASAMLHLVGIPDPELRMNQFPHEFSGGMRQRAMIAIALVRRPKLLIADEPTTALDMTVQAQLLQIMKDSRVQWNTSILWITHDLGVAADVCDRVMVMYAGEVVESGTKREIFRNPRHPYTKALMRAVPRLDQDKEERLASIAGAPPDLSKPPDGCAYCARCGEAMAVCTVRTPELLEVSRTQSVKCWLTHPMAQEAGTSRS